MFPLRLGRLWSLLTSMEMLMGLLWLGLAAFTIALVVLIWTRWGQYRPLRKCLLLSLLAHLLLAGYATTVEIVGQTPPIQEPLLRISYVEGPAGPGSGPGAPALADGAGEETSEDADAAVTKSPTLPTTAAPEPKLRATTAAAKPESPEAPPEAMAAPRHPDLPPPPVPMSRPAVEKPSWSVATVSGKYLSNADTGLDLPAPSGLEDIEQSVLNVPVEEAAASQEAADGSRSDPAATPVVAVASAVRPQAETPQPPIPDAYRLRVDADHTRAIQGGGGSPETEAAVQAALKWLTDHQTPDGRWDAKQHEAGRDNMADGRSRPQAGLRADTGMTGLALLSLLASGHTHLRGPYQDNVRRGLEFLLRTQDASGSLAGQSDRFAMMYCHAMATFAMSEAYGMTADGRLNQPVRRAIGYTIAAQDPNGGGWRYRPRDPGDTSQLGWQLMALKSAELAGIPVPDQTRQAILRYLQSVSSGQQGGLASYRPGEQITRSMTAEALVCWQFLGIAREHPSCNEAGDYLLGELPGESRPNFYYWYYGTLATYQLQGEHWRRWNDAIRLQLLAMQQTAGDLAGSWDPDPVWGGYGGRIYSTSLATLCLEVYYRYLPLYVQARTARR